MNHKTILYELPLTEKQSFRLGYATQSYIRHYHSEIEIYYCISPLTVIVNNNSYMLMSGDILLIGSFEVHELIMQKESSALIIEFGGALFGDEFNNFFISQFTIPLLKNDSDNNGIILLRNNFKNLILYADMKVKGILYTAIDILRIKSQLMSIGALLLEFNQMNDTASEYIKNNFYIHQKFFNIFKFVEDNYMKDITVMVVAKNINYDCKYFCRIFKKVTGTTFHKYLNAFRIEKSLILLNAHFPINKIGETVGIPNYQTFTRIFKKITGTSPYEYQKSKK